ncbi:threonylcarbamoyl-AMP synthase, partial [Candidatus Woesearchaeota archaeon]|nr:threonylcarbamoyl-AMP synthase [Candidatus Woesearchaeota archaeon]
VILVVDVRKIKNIVENERKNGNKVGLICTSKSIDADEIIFVGKRPENLGKILFDALRFLDKKVDVIVVEGVKEEGFGLAVMNRLKRAASRIV